MHTVFRIVTILLCILAAAVPAMADAIPLVTRSSNESGMVRVRLDSLGSPGTYTLTASGLYRAGDVTIPDGSSVTVKSSGGSFTMSLKGTSYDMGASFWLTRAGSASSVKIAQAVAPANQYPGDIRFTYQNGSPYIICSVFIEDYLPGVVGYEMSDSFPLEALKAQAISARTYAMRKAAVSSGNYYDVRDTTADQVYRGTPGGKSNVKTAVDATSGMTLMYADEYCQVYYSSSNGGQTESNNHAWGGSPLPYYQIQDDPYDLANPSATARKGTVYSAFAKNSGAVQSLIAEAIGSPSIQTIESIELTSPKYDAPSRLYTQARIKVILTDGSARDGVVALFSGLDKALGLNMSGSKNELFYVESSSSGFTVTARRYGHGVGLSQYGAQQMASTGYDYLNILGFYFKGASLVRHSYSASSASGGSPQVMEPVTAPELTPSSSPSSGAVTALVALDDPAARLNLRSAPNENASILAKVPNGSTILVNSADANGWIRATYDGATGYVVSRYVRASAQSAIQLPSPVSSTTPVTPSIPLIDTGAGAVTARVSAAGGSGTLNLREQPSTDANIIIRIPSNAEVTMRAQDASSDAQWVLVAYNGMTGYVMRQYLAVNGQANRINQAAVSPPAGVIVPELKPAEVSSGSQMVGMGRVSVEKATGHLNLREEPKPSAPVLVAIKQGEQVEVYAVGAEWSEIRYQGVYGYASSKYIKMDSKGSAAEGPAVTTLAASQGAPAVQAVSNTAPAASSVKASGAGWIATESGSGNVYLRAKASSSAAVRDRVPHGSAVDILSVDGSWTRVKYNGQTGYVRSEYVRTSAPAVSAPAAVTTQSSTTPVTAPVPAPVIAQISAKAVNTARVKLASGGSSLNMRASANASADTIVKVPDGATIDILGYVAGGEWALSRYGSQIGFLSLDYLKLAYPTASVKLNPGETISVRKEPAADGAFLMAVRSGDILTVLSAGAEWTQVCADGGVTGYVLTSALR